MGEAKQKKIWIGILALLLVIAGVLFVWKFGGGKMLDGISGKTRSGDSGKYALVVASPHPTAFVKPLINEFEEESGISVKVISCGTMDAIKAVEEGEADALWGGSMLAVSPYQGLFSERVSFSNVPSVLIVNTDLIGDIKIEGYADLLNPELKGKIACANPAYSSSAFEHLVNMLYAMGEGDPEQGWDYAKQLAEQLEGNLLTGSSEVYEGVANGKYLVGLTFEEAAITMLKSDKHVALVYMKEGVVFTPDGIYISKNTGHGEQAKAFLTFLTSFDTQQRMAHDLGRRSVREDVSSPEEVKPMEEIRVIRVDNQVVTKQKDTWAQRFDALVQEGRNESKN